MSRQPGDDVTGLTTPVDNAVSSQPDTPAAPFSAVQDSKRCRCGVRSRCAGRGGGRSDSGVRQDPAHDHRHERDDDRAEDGVPEELVDAEIEADLDGEPRCQLEHGRIDDQGEQPQRQDDERQREELQHRLDHDVDQAEDHAHPQDRHEPSTRDAVTRAEADALEQEGGHRYGDSVDKDLDGDRFHGSIVARAHPILSARDWQSRDWQYSADMSHTVRLRETLAAVPAYKPGAPTVAREWVTAYKISSNENPYPPLPSVLTVVHDAALQMNRYPDMAVTELTQKIAQRLGVPAEHISTGTGSVGVLGQIIAATCDPGDEVIYAWRSFEAYPIVVAIAGAVSVQVPLD